MEAPTLNITRKIIQIEAPSSTAIPSLRAALADSLRKLQTVEQFMLDANDAESSAATREAQFTIHAFVEGLNRVAQENYKELIAYQEAMTAYNEQQANFGVSFASAATPETPQE
jgi:hypothetical protein